MREMGVPLLIHQPSYSMLNRWIEEGLLDALVEEGMGCIAFSPLAQGVLTDKYLKGIPEDARINQPGGDSLQRSHLSEENLAHVRALNEIAKARGQSLAQMALAWTLRDPRVTSALIGASRPEQVIENVGALENLEFTPEELAAIDAHAQEGGPQPLEAAVPGRAPVAAPSRPLRTGAVIEGHLTRARRPAVRLRRRPRAALLAATDRTALPRHGRRGVSTCRRPARRRGSTGTSAASSC